MSKTFYTERDIEDLARRGVQSLEVNDEVVLTELALEKAERLGVALVREHDTPPSAPMRPYIAEPAPSKPVAKSSRQAGGDDLHQRVKAAVVGRLGNQLDANLLDSIIRRVLDNLGK